MHWVVDVVCDRKGLRGSWMRKRKDEFAYQWGVLQLLIGRQQCGIVVLWRHPKESEPRRPLFAMYVQWGQGFFVGPGFMVALCGKWGAHFRSIEHGSTAGR